MKNVEDKLIFGAFKKCLGLINKDQANNLSGLREIDTEEYSNLLVFTTDKESNKEDLKPEEMQAAERIIQFSKAISRRRQRADL